MFLCDAKKNEEYLITELIFTGKVLSRFESLTLKVGKRVKVKGWSLLNSSVLIEFDGRLIAIRKSIARQIKVSRV